MRVGIESCEFSFFRNREYVGIITLTKMRPECFVIPGWQPGRARKGVKAGLGVDQTNCGFVMAYPLMEHGEDADCPRGVFSRAEKQ